MRSVSGNSLIEYTLPLAVLFVAGALLALIGDVPGRLAEYFADTMNGSAEGGTVFVEPLGSGALPNASPPRNPYPRQITLANGTVIDLPTFPDLATSIETAGGAGTTDILAQNLETIVKSLQDAGEISDEEANELLRLARQGHEIATVQRLIEEAAANANGDYKAFRQARVMYDGQERSVNKLLDFIAASMDSKPKLALKALNRDDKGYVLKEFNQRLAAAKKMDILQTNPELKEVVQILSQEIAFSGSVYRVSVAKAQKQKDSLAPETLYERSASAFRDNAANIFPEYYSSDANDVRSDGICGIGGGSNCQNLPRNNGDS